MIARVRLARGLPVALGLLCGCSSKVVNLGRDPDILWWTDHETGDLSDWQQGDSGTWLADGGTLTVDTQHARSGRYSLDALALSASAGVTSAAMLLRTGGLPESAYYSAWFYLPSGVATADYWLIFKFRSRTPDPNPVDVELWDLDVIPQGGAFQLSLYQHTSTSNAGTGMMLQPERALAVPLERWFQVEAYFRAATDDTGELTVWQDGTELYDIQRARAPSTYVQWSAGSAVQALSSGQARVFVDDAAISLRQLGPNFPPFWRGE